MKIYFQQLTHLSAVRQFLARSSSEAYKLYAEVRLTAKTGEMRQKQFLNAWLGQVIKDCDA